MSHPNLYDLMEKLTPERKARVIRRCEELIKAEQITQDMQERIRSGKVKITVAPTDNIAALVMADRQFVQNFFTDILRLNLNEVALTDDSSLYDFIPTVREPDEDTTMYHARRNIKVAALKKLIRDVYQVPPETELPTRLVGIFSVIMPGRR